MLRVDPGQRRARSDRKPGTAWCGREQVTGLVQPHQVSVVRRNITRLLHALDPIGAEHLLAFVQAAVCTYTLHVRITFDPGKNERNIQERSLSFGLAAEFEFETAHIQTDSRQEYSEVRYIALGSLHGRLHVLCFTETSDGIRVISFRKANDREVKRYAKVQVPD